jgi:FkbM family methyltransferase
MINLYRKLKYLIQGKYIIVNQIKKNKQWLGNSYGGFYVSHDSLCDNSIVYSIGIGEDVSFDLDIIEKYSCKIFAYDPTPKSVNWINKNVSNKNFNFYPIGISNEKGTKMFYLPKESKYVSGSLKKISTVNESNTLRLYFDTLKNQMIKNKHQKIDILKMDIEGSEYDVIDSILNENIEIDQILVEFHPHLIQNGRKKTKKTIIELESFGYKCFARSNSFLEYSFIKLKQD